MPKALVQTQQPLLLPDIEVAPSPMHGFGVFAKRAFSKGEVIEQCPVIIISEEEIVPSLYPYWFCWKKDSAVALGYGTIYNHSDNPNVQVKRLYNQNLLSFEATRDIAKGEELCHFYSKSFADKAKKHAKEEQKPLKINFNSKMFIKIGVVVTAYILANYFLFK